MWQVQDLMDSCRHNHLETINNFNAFKIYKSGASHVSEHISEALDSCQSSLHLRAHTAEALHLDL